MKYFIEFCNYISRITNVEDEYVILILSTLLVILVAWAFKQIGLRIIARVKDEEVRYIQNKTYRVIVNVIEGFILFFVWDDYIKSLMTLISLVSAAFLLALRDIIFNWFSGIYIKVKKVFVVEDRISVDGIKGDVMNISTLEFELLEVSDDEANGQSTGVVINFPNSYVFSKPIKNYTKGFKYIWNEMTIKLELDSDIEGAKKELYRIINEREELKNIPRKMKQQINNINSKYRIYYNNYEPVIYTKIVDGHVEMKLRYLMNPKKARYFENIIWMNILEAYKDKKIALYKVEI